MVLMDLVKRAGWRAGLVPFVKCVCVYWACEGAGAGAGAGGAAAKCAPVLWLLVLVMVHRAGAADRTARAYCAWTAAGLGASALGDALLVWDALAGGMLAFGLAHAAYLRALALRPAPAAPALALTLCGAALAYSAVLRPPPALRPLVPLYALLLAAMAWRAGAGAGAGAGGRCAAAGGALFLASDALLAWSLFNGPVPHKQVLVMSSYYLAQLCLALSAVLPSATAPAPAPDSAPGKRDH